MMPGAKVGWEPGPSTSPISVIATGTLAATAWIWPIHTPLDPAAQMGAAWHTYHDNL